jgi:putative tricarboxylic transport membrane protein
MTTHYRTTRAWAAVAAAILAAAQAPVALAQEMRAPEGAIEITVGCSAGCTPDVLMRRAGQIWNATGLIENPIVIVNRPGGGMTAAINHVVGLAGDENNLLALAEPVFSTPIVQGIEPAYTRLTPLGVFVQTQLVVLARPDHPASTLPEMIEYARANPAAVLVAGSSAGGTDEQVMGLIEAAGGVDMTFVPHDGGGAAQATFLGGNVDMITVTVDEGLPHIGAGNAKPLAILNAERSPAAELAGIPTAVEQGVDVVWGQVFGLLGPADLDPAVAAWWQEKIVALAASDAWQGSLRANFLGGAVYVGEGLPAQMDVFHQQRLEVLKRIGAVKS